MSDVNVELSAFLRRARSEVRPGARFSTDARARRVPGLRREEVAFLAGVSTDYYTRLEQGRKVNPSPSVVRSIARALDLDAAGRSHLTNLLHGRPAEERPRRLQSPGVRAGMCQLVEALDRSPAFIVDPFSDVLVSNRMLDALLPGFERPHDGHRNYVRWLLLSPHARTLFVDWPEQARAAVENLRLNVAARCDDRAGAELVAELDDRSDEFRRWWNEHRVHQRASGAKRLRHPLVGELTVNYETLSFPGDPSVRLFIYTTEPATSSRRAMDRLADGIGLETP